MLKIEVFPELRGYCFPRYLNSVGCMLKSETHQNRLITINIVMEKMQLPRSLIKNVKIIENPKKKTALNPRKMAVRLDELQGLSPTPLPTEGASAGRKGRSGIGVGDGRWQQRQSAPWGCVDTKRLMT